MFMKLISRFLAFFLIAIFSSQAFSYISGKASIKEKLFYCPEKVICEKINNISSCRYNSETPEYWGSLGASTTPANVIGTYKFQSVRTDYHSTLSHRLLFTQCFYAIDGGSNISLSSNYTPVLEASYDKSTKWQITGAGDTEVWCHSDNAELCPLREASGFGLIYLNDTKSNYILKIIANNSFIAGARVTGAYLFVKYEDVGVCWSSKECKLDFEINNGEYDSNVVGSVTVDMDNKMKIIKEAILVPDEVKIRRIEPFNIVEISKKNGNVAPLSIEIINSIRSVVNVSGGNTPIVDIVSNRQARLSIDQLVKTCGDKRECKIDLWISGNARAGLIGSIIFDMKNDLDIISVQATRKSEIMIKEIDSHAFDIRYPDSLG